MRGDVELHEIRVFLTLAGQLHFGKTAEVLGITPSYVSQTVRRLEARLGGRLFERTSRRVTLTPLGEQLLAGLEPAHQRLLDVLDEARQAAVGVAGTLRVAMYTESLAGRHLLSIIRAFESRYPAARVTLMITGLERSYLDILRQGRADMLATRLPLSDPDITVGPVISSERRVLLVARSDPLARRESVTLEDFAGHAVSDAPAFPREMMDALIPPAAPSGRRFRRVVNRNIEEMLLSIAAGRQVHPTVPYFLEHHAHPDVASVPIDGLPPSRTALAWLTASRSPAILAFARAAADVLGRTEVAGYQPGPKAPGSADSRLAPVPLRSRRHPDHRLVHHLPDRTALSRDGMTARAGQRARSSPAGLSTANSA
jgi:DNA-binding transcriptional LysR family regulator